MVNKPRIKGTNAETAVVRYLRDHGHPHAERRSLRGSADWGDITGTPGLCWEVKAAARLNLAGWLRETETERVASRADFGILVVKPVGMGTVRTGKWWALLYQVDYQRLLQQALIVRGAPATSSPMGELFMSGAKLHWLKTLMNLEVTPDNSPYLSVLVRPRGYADDEDHWYQVLNLSRLNELVIRAGYGGMENE